jgi:hypothetical protein
MKRTQKILFVVGTAAFGLVLGLGTAQAQVTGTGVTTGGVDLTLTGVVQSSVALTIGGAATTTVSPVFVGAPSRATVDFGTFNSQTGGVSTGTFYRGVGGGYAVASLIATAVYSGAGGAGLASIDYSLFSGTAGVNTLLSLGAPANWTATPGAIAVDATVKSLCPNGFVATDAVPGDCASGDPRAHDIGVFVPDAFAGAFTQVVRYTATVN